MTGFFIPLGKSGGEKRKEKGAGVGGELWRNLKSHNSSECNAKEGGLFGSGRRIRRTEGQWIEEKQASRRQCRNEMGTAGGFEGTTRDRKEKEKKKQGSFSLPLLKQRSLRTGGDKNNFARGPSRETRVYRNVVIKDHDETLARRGRRRRNKRELFVKHPNDRRARSRRRLVLTDLKARARYERLTKSERRGRTEGEPEEAHETEPTEPTEEMNGETPRRDDSCRSFFNRTEIRRRRMNKKKDEGGEGGTKGEQQRATAADKQQPIDGSFSVERKKRWRNTSEEAEARTNRKFRSSPDTYESKKKETDEASKPSIGLSKKTYVRKTRRGQIFMNDMIRKLLSQIEPQT